MNPPLRLCGGHAWGRYILLNVLNILLNGLSLQRHHVCGTQNLNKPPQAVSHLAKFLGAYSRRTPPPLLAHLHVLVEGPELLWVRQQVCGVDWWAAGLTGHWGLHGDEVHEVVSWVGVGRAGVAHLRKVVQGASSRTTVHLHGSSRAMTMPPGWPPGSTTKPCMHSLPTHTVLVGRCSCHGMAGPKPCYALLQCDGQQVRHQG